MPKSCTYIIGERGKNFRRYEEAPVCDEPAVEGSSWCERHLACVTRVIDVEEMSKEKVKRG